ncbi:MAG: caspase family protein [Xanthobacteraceae bacterium]
MRQHDCQSGDLGRGRGSLSAIVRRAVKYLGALPIVPAMMFLLVAPASADKRVALVIGNGAYVNVPHLPNPPNDAKDVADALQRSGFETILGLDLDKAGMDAAAVSPAPRGMQMLRCSITAATPCSMRGSTTWPRSTRS